jgi:hypothetical protein
MNTATALYTRVANISYPLPIRGDNKRPSPYSNTGERYTKGWSQSGLNSKNTAFIDYLTIVLPVRELKRIDPFQSLEEFSGVIAHYLLKPLGFTHSDIKGGRNGYKNHWKILSKSSKKTIDKKGKEMQPPEVGFFCFGGNNDTICISFTGLGCQSIGQDGFTMIRETLEDTKGHITRVDLTHDCLLGEVSLDCVRSWYESGLFRSSTRGKYPNAQIIDDMGSGKGSSFYVGSRESGKYFRAYEKGKQLGDKNSKWVRLELEILNKKRAIPYEILDKVGEYLSGGYKCLTFLNTEQSRIETLQKTDQISYEHLEHYAKQSYGRFIDVMLYVYGGCPELVVEQLRRDDALPARLIPASIQVKQ